MKTQFVETLSRSASITMIPQIGLYVKTLRNSFGIVPARRTVRPRRP